MSTHAYAARIVWEGNRGEGTASYTAYDREYRIRVDGKPDLHGSANVVFRGDPALHDPEDLFLASLSACHMLSYLALCARAGLRVLAYEDDARTHLAVRSDGGGRLEEVVLRPVVTIAPGSDPQLAARLHDTAHDQCFLAASCSVPVRHEPVLRVGGTEPAGDSTGVAPLAS